ncbi:MAG: DEAD/DEAH box helicase [Bacillus sp. (in: Bacteria)]|nr:DEAD/DEAH box helicase [Bacillus sp. (in: firmicutes)]MCM1426333.1 DEAD/DEAH box helicase [Eubacterium sp.]
METKTEEKNEQEAQEEKATLKYRDSGIDERIIRAVEEMGFENMTPIQEQAIPVFLSGRDVIGQAQTGTGKTAAFGIPLLEKINPENKNLQAVILCPTRELAMQAADEMRKFSKYMHGIKVLPIYGGQDIVRQIKNLKGGVQIVVGTPGRVMDHMRRHTLKMENVHTIVLDEADEMLNMGFREDIETILKEVPEERQTALFSATMPKPILEITRKYQKDAQFLKMTPKEVTIPLIKQAYYQVQHKDKEEVLCRLMDYYDPARALIFCNTKRMVDELTQHLKERGYAVEGLHGDLAQHQRDTVMNLFKSGHAAVLIATDVAARGIDIDNVEAVFNYDVPEDIEYYVHRIGRTGRAGKTGRSFTLVTGKEIYKLRDIERICHTKIRERKIPSAENIMAKKAEKILKEAETVIAGQNLDNAMQYIMERCSEGEYGALQYAAAFMKMKLGDELEEIRPERFALDWMAQGKKRYRGNNGSDRKYPAKGRQGKGGEKRDADRNGRYASLRIKTKKQDRK